MADGHRPDAKPRTVPNDLVVAAIDGHAHVKRLVEVNGRPMLRADADDSTTALNDGDQIFGRHLRDAAIAANGIGPSDLDSV